MDTNKIKEILNENDITNLMIDLGSAYPKQTKDALMFTTICHGGDSSKLYYYHETKTFRCYTHCSCNYDIFSLVQKVLDIGFNDAYNYICRRFGISVGFKGGFFETVEKEDISFIYKFDKKEENLDVTVYEDIILNHFNKFYHKNWIDDGISIGAMRKYGIRYHILSNKIIIPVYNIDNKLIGVRGRALNEDEIADGFKYMPIKHKGVFYTFPTGGNLYGLNVVKERIKKYKRVILFESEKACMQLETMLGEQNVGVAISGSSLSKYQIDLLINLGVEEVVIGLDKEFEAIGTDQEKEYREKIKTKFVDRLAPYFNVSVIWDTQGLICYKDAPTDKGKETFLKLYSKRIKCQ